MVQSIKKADHSQVFLVVYLLFISLFDKITLSSSIIALGMFAYSAYRFFLIETKVKPMEESINKKLQELNNRLAKIENRESLGKFAEQQRPQRMF